MNTHPFDGKSAVLAPRPEIHEKESLLEGVHAREYQKFGFGGLLVENARKEKTWSKSVFTAKQSELCPTRVFKGFERNQHLKPFKAQIETTYASIRTSEHFHKARQSQ